MTKNMMTGSTSQVPQSGNSTLWRKPIHSASSSADIFNASQKVATNPKKHFPSAMLVSAFNSAQAKVGHTPFAAGSKDWSAYRTHPLGQSAAALLAHRPDRLLVAAKSPSAEAEQSISDMSTAFNVGPASA